MMWFDDSRNIIWMDDVAHTIEEVHHLKSELIRAEVEIELICMRTVLSI